MADKKDTKDDCTTGSCPVVGDKASPKLLKARDLPLLGNPHPPKDVIQEDTPSSLELTVRSIRTTIQPYMAPVCAAYQKTSDILSIGAAHSQSAIENLRENQSGLSNGLLISGAGLLGFTLARRRGIFRKLLYGSIFAGTATAFCYPKEAKEKAELALFIAKNKIPELMQHRHQGQGENKKSVAPTNPITTSDDTKVTKS